MRMSTKENLEAAFAGESQANRRYLAFAKKADEDSRIMVARLFRAAAEAETVHAHNHLKVLGEVKSTEENLKAAIQGENYEHTRMYPEFLEEAKKDGNQEAQTSFDFANKVEVIHEGLYKKALEAVQAGKDLEMQDIHVCTVCGNTFLGEVPDNCPICMRSKDRFIQVK
jgi:rubrerythrin